jgi:hypothetical protein
MVQEVSIRQLAFEERLTGALPSSDAGQPMLYSVPFAVEDAHPVKQLLNNLYRYGPDLDTNVLHRARSNLFTRTLDELEAPGEIRAKKSAIDIGSNASMYAKIPLIAASSELSVSTSSKTR